MLDREQVQAKRAEKEPPGADCVAAVVDHPSHRRAVRRRRHER